MPTIEITNIGPIPARTTVSFIDGIPMPTADMVVDGATLTKHYKCMDCDFETQDVNVMMEHQKDQKKHHTIWQRFKRWWYS